MRGGANALLGVVCTLLCLAAAEAVLRRLAERHDVRLASGERKTVFNPYRSDALLSYALRPGWSGIHENTDFRVGVRVNALGMRGAEPPREKTPGARRILVLGDSFAFGWGVGDDETFPARLAARWRRTGDPLELFDAAVPGYAADQHWIFLRERGFALAPDLIVLALCQNDAEDLGSTRLALGDDRLPLRTTSLRRFIAEDGRMHYLNEAGRPLPEGAVIVFAADSARWAAPSRFVKMATLDERGGFRVAGLPAASYLAVAVARLAPDWERPAVLEGLQGVASPFALAEGERQTLAIRVKERR